MNFFFSKNTFLYDKVDYIEDYNDFYEFEVGVENASTFSASVFLTGDTTSVSSLDKIGNILFLKFSQNSTIL